MPNRARINFRRKFSIKSKTSQKNLLHFRMRKLTLTRQSVHMNDGDSGDNAISEDGPLLARWSLPRWSRLISRSVGRSAGVSRNNVRRAGQNRVGRRENGLLPKKRPHGAHPIRPFAASKVRERETLFHGDAFGQIAGLIDIATAAVGDLVGEQLGGNGIEERIKILMHIGKIKDIVGQR